MDTASSRHQQLSPSASERRKAEYHPSVWGDYFISYDAPNDKIEFEARFAHQINDMKSELQRAIMDGASDDDPLKLVTLVDHTQRLGIGYMFERETNDALRKVYEMIGDEVDFSSRLDYDLHATALMFRVLREQGYNISSGVFKKFKGVDGNFDDSLKTDEKGLATLYEASLLRIHGEDILEEAQAFSLSELYFLKLKLNVSLDDDIATGLHNQFNIRKGLTRLDAIIYIRSCEEEPSHNESLLQLAKLDFNRVQMLHQEELAIIARWWKSLDVKKNFPYTRDRVVECYFWSMLAYEPHNVAFRIIFTKVIAMITIIDDTFDIHGTLEELEVFTKAIERWDMDTIDLLPTYMQVCYRALLEVYAEVERLLPDEVRSYSIYYGIESMKGMVRAYFEEAKWYHQRYTPTMEEYLEVSLVSGGALFLAATAFLGLNGVATKEDFEWLFQIPKIVKGSQILIRFVNDMVTHKFEQQRGHVDSIVECYMKQYGITEEEAKNELWKQVYDSWMDINEETLRLKGVISAPIINIIVDIARMIGIWYKGVDIYTHSSTKMKEGITSLFIDPLPIDM